MTQTSTASLTQLHRQRTGQSPSLFRAPGRVNLVGEHTDYADGFCMPAALQFGTTVAFSPRQDNTISAHSIDLNDTVTCTLEGLVSASPTGSWTDYVLGVLQLLLRPVPSPGGFDLTITGDVPRNSGLSSSASLEVAVAFAVSQSIGIAIYSRDLALLCQSAENHFVGAPCGIMDQFISVHGRRGHALQLDCRDLSCACVPLPDSTRLVITNSMVKHSVAGAEYAERRAQVEEGTYILQRLYPAHAIHALRDVSLNQLEQARAQLPDVVYHRCRHIVSDSQRVLTGGEFLRQGDIRAFGKVMNDAHQSYRDDFEASCLECDTLVTLARELPGCVGARLTGGGFGGCIVSLVEAARAEAFRDGILDRYQQATGIAADCWIGEPSDGAGRLEQ